MKPPQRPGSRGPYERVSVLKPPGQGRVVLGQSAPDTDDRRARAAAQWGQGSAAPRQQPLATIDTPLPPRVQTLLSYRVDPTLARQLVGGPSLPPVSRRAAEQPVQAIVTIGIGEIDGESKKSE